MRPNMFATSLRHSFLCAVAIAATASHGAYNDPYDYKELEVREVCDFGKI